MRFVTLLVIAGFSLGCITTTTTTEEEPEVPADARPMLKKDTGKPADPHRILMRCEYGCPSVPYIVIRSADIADTTDTSDSVDEDAGIDVAYGCADSYEFAICCGNGVCEESESAFFCPGDCY